MPPPAVARLGDEEFDLAPLAREVCRRYRGEFPDEAERYGDAGVAWCVHDTQHILNWAFLSPDFDGELLAAELSWLANVLRSRGFPIDRLARAVELSADVVDERVPGAQTVSAGLRAAATQLRLEAAEGTPSP